MRTVLPLTTPAPFTPLPCPFYPFLKTPAIHLFVVGAKLPGLDLPPHQPSCVRYHSHCLAESLLQKTPSAASQDHEAGCNQWHTFDRARDESVMNLIKDVGLPKQWSMSSATVRFSFSFPPPTL